MPSSGGSFRPSRRAGSFRCRRADLPITTQPVLNSHHAAAEAAGRDWASCCRSARRFERMGGRGIAHDDRQADPRQRPASRTRRPDPLVSRAHRDAGGLVKGATVPGAPVVLLGQNASIAWGFTSADTDTQDLFIETVDPANSAQYLTSDGPKPFETRDETIHVKGGPDVALHVRATRHGPVLSDVSPELADLAGPGKAMALAFHGPRRQGYEFRSADPRVRWQRTIGKSSSPRCDFIRRRRRISSMPTPPATSASSVPASCRCASQGDGAGALTDGAPRERPDWIGFGAVRAAAAIAQSARRLHLQRQ